MTEPLDFVFELRFHTQFVDVDLVEYLEEFGDELLFADVLIFTVPISRSCAAIVDVVRGRAVAELLVFVLRRDAGLT